MGYIILLAAIGSMVAILVHERKRIKEIEAESAEIRQVRRSINTAHRRITGLATLGEGVVNWNKADYLYYRNRRLQADSLLNLLKRHCREYVRPEQIDTLRALLAEKETHLLHIMEMFERRTEADSVLVNQLPEVARRATHIRTIEQKKKGIAGFFGKKEEIQVMPSQKELHDFSDSLIAIHQRQASEMDIYADSLRMRNRELNRTLNKLINDLDEQAQTAFSQRELKMAEAEKMSLEKSGYEAEITIDEPGARKLLKKESFDLVLSDVRLPEGDGISLLEWMRKERMDIPFIIMTGYASVPDAVQAIKLGAKDYLAKPVQMDELQRQLKDIFRPKSVICDKNKDLLPRNSLQMQEVEHLVSTVAPFDISVLILGPNGAGKESVAQRIHYIGERKDMPFVAVNCGVIPKELAPTLFFGHIKGTFTGADANKDGYFEMAKGGTLFLDEIGTLSLDVQAMLLRVLQEGTYIPIGGNKEKRANVRIVAATNEDLQLAIQEKRFREDLYHRLCEFEIVLPSLHECPDDILPLAHHFRKKFSGELKRPTEGFSSEAEQLLLSYRWPGNVRELHNRIRRAVLMAKQPLIETADLNIKLEAATDEINLFPENDAEEKHSIIQALKTSHGSRKQAAGILHIDPSTLYRKMKKYGLNDK